MQRASERHCDNEPLHLHSGRPCGRQVGREGIQHLPSKRNGQDTRQQPNLEALNHTQPLLQRTNGEHMKKEIIIESTMLFCFLAMPLGMLLLALSS